MDTPSTARIGPNAIRQVAQVLHEDDESLPLRVFSTAGLRHHLDTPPEEMVDEDEVARLQQALHAVLGTTAARAVSRRAGTRTGDYLLTHRIPRRVQPILRRMPAPWAGRVLLHAIAKHSWTFAGSGTFRFSATHPVSLEIAGCPVCRHLHTREPVCDFYAATFERIFRSLVHPASHCQQLSCAAAGAKSCLFQIQWR
ncbi:bacteriochlorophyll 4-vinyl reductase [Thioalkalicoccus limnaeus]|uniref:Bacteriochlorophyll 4-vinyl reductase n=1 Tax=Thioalkalicoccus limnaeus TaxID=120681 RepID=A0ABV4BHF0_9GAMM